MSLSNETLSPSREAFRSIYLMRFYAPRERRLEFIFSRKTLVEFFRKYMKLSLSDQTSIETLRRDFKLSIYDVTLSLLGGAFR